MTARGHRGEPVPQVRQVEGGQGGIDGLSVALTDAEETQQVVDVDEIGAHSVRGQVPLQGQVAAVGGEQIGARPRHGLPPPCWRQEHLKTTAPRRAVHGIRAADVGSTQPGDAALTGPGSARARGSRRRPRH